MEEEVTDQEKNTETKTKCRFWCALPLSLRKSNMGRGLEPLKPQLRCNVSQGCKNRHQYFWRGLQCGRSMFELRLIPLSLSRTCFRGVCMSKLHPIISPSQRSLACFKMLVNTEDPKIQYPKVQQKLSMV